MSDSRQHAYVRTRVAIMASRLLSRAGLEEMVELSLDDIELSRLLGGLAPEAVMSDGRIGPTVRALLHRLLVDHSILLRPFTGPNRELLDYWGRKFELFNLKALIRGKLNGLDATTIEQQLYDTPPRMRLPYQTLLQAENVQELLRILDQGHYHEIARQARQVYEAKNEPFSLDATIDQRYYSGLMKQARECEEADREPLRQLIGTMIDQQNILWLLRYRFAYQLPPSETYYLLIPHGRLLKRGRLLRLVELRTFEQVLEQLPAPLDRLLQDAINPSEVGNILDDYIVAEGRQALHRSPSAITAALAFLLLREIELHRLFAIIRGKALQLPPSLIRFAAGLDDQLGDYPGEAPAAPGSLDA